MCRSMSIDVRHASRCDLDYFLGLLPICRHRNLTRPFTLPNGQGENETYVTCLDCTRKLASDPETMRVRYRDMVRYLGMY
jgi:hypothetical protein